MEARILKPVLLLDSAIHRTADSPVALPEPTSPTARPRPRLCSRAQRLLFPDIAASQELPEPKLVREQIETPSPARHRPRPASVVSPDAVPAAARPPRCHQGVPWPPPRPWESSRTPSTTHVGKTRKSDPERSTSPGPCTTTVAPKTLESSSTTPNERVPLPSPCTTTSTTVVMYNYFPRRPENVYFLYIVPNSIRPENARFKGITAENDRRGPNVCVE